MNKTKFKSRACCNNTAPIQLPSLVGTAYKPEPRIITVTIFGKLSCVLRAFSPRFVARAVLSILRHGTISSIVDIKQTNCFDSKCLSYVFHVDGRMNQRRRQ